MKRFIILLSCAAVIAGCSKENSDNFYSYPAPTKDTVWHAALPSNSAVLELDQMFQTTSNIDSFQVGSGGTVIFTKGSTKMMLSFPANFASGAGGTTLAPNAKIRIQAVHLDSKGDMIRFARPTTSFNKLLVTGGAVFVKATYEGNEVSIASGKNYNLKITNRFSNPQPSTVMQLFYGAENVTLTNAQSNFTWEQSILSPSQVGIWFDSSTQAAGYTAFPNRLRWVNCDHFYDTTQPKTMVSAFATSQFTNANTSVYAVFKNLNIVVRLNTDAVNRIFYQHNMPIGQVVRLVSISKIDNKLYMGSKEVTVAAGLNVKLEPVEKSKQEIETFLDSL